jgi:predicted O-methyltransferase YrrM
MSLLEIIKNKSLADNIPIVRDQTVDFIKNIIEQIKTSTILEIGTAYGYSAYAMSECSCVKTITTIEKDIKRFEIARAFLQKEGKIVLVNADAFNYPLDRNYDLIFIDGCKSHQEILVDKCLSSLSIKGKIIIDNINFQKFNGVEELTKNQSKLIKKVETFKQ